MTDRYEEDASQSEVITRLHRLAALSHDQNSDNYGYNQPTPNVGRESPSADNGRVPTTQARPEEGSLDQYGPHPYTDSVTDRRQADNE